MNEPKLVIGCFKEHAKKWEYCQGPLMSDIVDPACDKLGVDGVDKVMSLLADRITKFTGVDCRWIHIKDCSSWSYSDHGRAHFVLRKPRTPAN